jgi:hypothetical protein
VRWVDFEYCGFQDVPRSILVRLRGGTILLDSQFVESLDEYDDHYRVFRLPRDVDPAGAWSRMVETAGPPIGRVSVVTLRFDETKRRQLDLDCLARVVPADLLAR